MTKKIALFENKTPKKRLKFQPLKVNKLRSPGKTSKPRVNSNSSGLNLIENEANSSTFVSINDKKTIDTKIKSV